MHESPDVRSALHPGAAGGLAQRAAARLVSQVWGSGPQNGRVPRPSATPLVHQRLAALFAAGLLLLNFPLLVLWDQAPAATLFGLPLLPLGLFTVWALLIGLLAWVLETAPD